MFSAFMFYRAMAAWPPRRLEALTVTHWMQATSALQLTFFFFGSAKALHMSERRRRDFDLHLNVQNKQNSV